MISGIVDSCLLFVLGLVLELTGVFPFAYLAVFSFSSFFLFLLSGNASSLLFPFFLSSFHYDLQLHEFTEHTGSLKRLWRLGFSSFFLSSFTTDLGWSMGVFLSFLLFFTRFTLGFKFAREA